MYSSCAIMKYVSLFLLKQHNGSPAATAVNHTEVLNNGGNIILLI